MAPARAQGPSAFSGIRPQALQPGPVAPAQSQPQIAAPQGKSLFQLI